jgi:hypothetical protein
LLHPSTATQTRIASHPAAECELDEPIHHSPCRLELHTGHVGQGNLFIALADRRPSKEALSGDSDHLTVEPDGAVDALDLDCLGHDQRPRWLPQRCKQTPRGGPEGGRKVRMTTILHGRGSHSAATMR